MITQLTEIEYHPYYAAYIKKAMHEDIILGLENGKVQFKEFVAAISQEKMNYAYQEGKWTIAEVLLHLIDAERIFAYRALRFARNDKTPIIGFEQDDYVPYSNANQYTVQEIIDDFEAVRTCTISLFKNFTTEMLIRVGEASGSPMSTRAVGYILQGHQNHHFEVIAEKYL
ncbi:DinB family protein [Aquimarina algicola]|uniref:DinB family protein n=1 Tax=Aquimarina algicola TaxID=2589995 RepID=A0A504JL08_9FLAO|nr:DinB family protein [Aquimarina algicola]TPN89045.1 DinB family protein [Aquimarina algicola]